MESTDNGGSLCSLRRLHDDNKKKRVAKAVCTSVRNLDGSLVISIDLSSYLAIAL